MKAPAVQITPVEVERIDKLSQARSEEERQPETRAAAQLMAPDANTPARAAPRAIRAMLPPSHGLLESRSSYPRAEFPKRRRIAGLNSSAN